MAIDIIMPVLGMMQEKGKIIRWLKQPGEVVSKGEALIEVETDKAVMEIEAPGDGVLANVTGMEGQEVPVTTVIAQILTAEEAAQGLPEAGTPAAPPSTLPGLSATTTPTTIVSPLAQRIAEEHQVDVNLIEPNGGRIRKADVLAYLDARQSTGRLLASPKARRLLAEYGLDAEVIHGSGPEGALLATDVEAARLQRQGSQVVGTPAIAPDQPEPISSTQTPPLSATWRIMAERTTQSWTSTPHFFLMREVNASQLILWRAELNERLDVKVTYTDLLVKAVSASLRQHPRVNASWVDGRIQLLDGVHIGLAVATDEGLVVPVIRDADQKGVRELAAERKRLVERAQAGRLYLDDLQDGRFTISNLGMFEVDVFNAIINPPQAAILAVGRIAERVVPLNGQPAIQPMMVLSLSCDHRVIDGALGAKFLQTVVEIIEKPLSLLD